MKMSTSSRQASVAMALAACAVAVAVTQPAAALLSAGAEAGIAGRSASVPNGLKIGAAFGVHGDVDLLPLVRLGPYFLHYELAASDRPDPLAADASFNAFGLRTRVRVPLTARMRAYGSVGLGYTFASYTAPWDRSGHFWECPLGLGVGYEVIDILELSVEGAYRPGFAFGGGAFGDQLSISRPGAGFSVLLGATVEF
jgi:hypothetical protein